MTIKTEFVVSAKDRTGRVFDSIDKRLGGLQKQLNGFSRITSLLPALAGGAGLTALSRYADQMSGLRARISLVTDSTEELNRVQGQLFQIAQKTRSPLEATSELYSRMAIGTRDLGVSQSELLSITDLVSKSIKIGGATTAEAAAATLQLSQALASGRLQGDEFRSLMETAPALMRSVAEGMGLPVGALKELSKEGVLTTDVIINAIQSQEKAINESFSKIPPTIGQTMVQAKNVFLNALSEFDVENNFSAKVVSAMKIAGDAILLVVDNFKLLAGTILTVFLTNAVAPLVISIQRVGIGMVALNAKIALTTVAVTGLSRVIAVLTGPIGIGLAIAGFATLALRQDDATKASDLLEKSTKELNTVLGDSVSASSSAGQETFKLTQQHYQAAKAALVQAEAIVELKLATDRLSFKEGGFGNDIIAATNKVDELKASVERGEAALRDYTAQTGLMTIEITKAGGGVSKTTEEITKSTSATKQLTKEYDTASAVLEQHIQYQKQISSEYQTITDRLNPAEAATRKFREEQQVLVETMEAGIITYKEYAEENDKLIEEFENAGKATEDFGKSFGDVFDDVIKFTKEGGLEIASFGEVVGGIFEDLATTGLNWINKLIEEGIKSLISWLGELAGIDLGGLFGGSSGGLGDLIGSIFGGGSGGSGGSGGGLGQLKDLGTIAAKVADKLGLLGQATTTSGAGTVALGGSAAAAAAGLGQLGVAGGLAGGGVGALGATATTAAAGTTGLAGSAAAAGVELGTLGAGGYTAAGGTAAAATATTGAASSFGSAAAAAGPYVAALAAIAFAIKASGGRSQYQRFAEQINDLSEGFKNGTSAVHDFGQGIEGLTHQFNPESTFITGQHVENLETFFSRFGDLQTRVIEINGQPILRITDEAERGAEHLNQLIAQSGINFNSMAVISEIAAQRTAASLRGEIPPAFEEMALAAGVSTDDIADYFDLAAQKIKKNGLDIVQSTGTSFKLVESSANDLSFSMVDVMNSASVKITDAIGGAANQIKTQSSAAGSAMEGAISSAANSASSSIEGMTSSAVSSLGAATSAAIELAGAINSIEDKTVTVHTVHTSSGGSSSSSVTGPGFADGTGGRFLKVPSGFPNDSYPVFLQSGEDFMVRTPSDRSSGAGLPSGSSNQSSSTNSAMVVEIRAVKKELQSLRSESKSSGEALRRTVDVSNRRLIAADG